MSAPSTAVRGGFAVAGTLVRSQTASSTAQSLEIGRRWLALGPETSFVNAHLHSAAASFGTQSPARLQTANPSIKRTCLRQAAYALRWACRNTVCAMQMSEQLQAVEHVNRFTAAVGVGRPSFGGRRTVGSHRRAAVGCCSLRCAARIGRKPSRCVVSTPEVGALGHQATARLSSRPAQPVAQADGFAAA
jgi:hypothetical protein